MNGVTQRIVAPDEAGLRLDRWFKRHLPGVNHSRLEKLLRTGQVRVDGARVKANLRLDAGQQIRIPPLEPDIVAGKRTAPPVDPHERKFMRKLVLFENEHAIVLNKPAGLAVQGGTKTVRHLDGMLGALVAEDAPRPKLVHRLDRDTSGVLLLAKSASAAAHFAKAFRQRETRKVYWALTAGVPSPPVGRIDLALVKQIGGRDGEHMAIADPEAENAQRAITDYRVISQAGFKVGFVLLEPVTGRTHQLRAHLAALRTPILGDPKYGLAQGFAAAIPAGLQLHARAIFVTGPDKAPIVISAPPPPHMKEALRFFGFEASEADAAMALDGPRMGKLPLSHLAKGML